MRVGFTGTREGMTLPQRNTLIAVFTEIGPTEFHHGDCIGCDLQAHHIVRDMFPDTPIIIHPPRCSTYRAWCLGNEYKPPHDYLVRNQHIVNSSEVLIAVSFTEQESLRSGTWATVRKARKASKPIIIIPPSGSGYWNAKDF